MTAAAAWPAAAREAWSATHCERSPRPVSSVSSAAIMAAATVVGVVVHGVAESVVSHHCCPLARAGKDHPGPAPCGRIDFGRLGEVIALAWLDADKSCRRSPQPGRSLPGRNDSAENHAPGSDVGRQRPEGLSSVPWPKKRISASGNVRCTIGSARTRNIGSLPFRNGSGVGEIRPRTGCGLALGVED